MRLWPRRLKVLLTTYDERVIIATARQTQSGLIARWIGNDDAWSILLATGKTKGTSVIVSWRPYSGFTPAELEAFEKSRL